MTAVRNLRICLLCRAQAATVDWGMTILPELRKSGYVEQVRGISHIFNHWLQNLHLIWIRAWVEHPNGWWSLTKAVFRHSRIPHIGAVLKLRRTKLSAFWFCYQSYEDQTILIETKISVHTNTLYIGKTGLLHKIIVMIFPNLWSSRLRKQ